MELTASIREYVMTTVWPTTSAGTPLALASTWCPSTSQTAQGDPRGPPPDRIARRVYHVPDIVRLRH
jgi:hypothetical protein